MTFLTNPSAKAHLIGGALVVLFAALLLIPHMADWSMWYDEVNMVENALTLDMGEFYRIERQVYTSHPPLYFLLLKGWSELAGESDAALRFLSVLPVLLAAAWVYRTAADFAGGAFGGLAAGVSFAAMGFLKLYAHTTHNYTWFLVAVAALLFFYHRWWRRPRRYAYTLGVIVCTVAGFYTHYYAIYVIAAFNLHALGMAIRRRRDGLRWLGGQVIAGALCLPWLPVLLRLASGDYDRFGDKDRLLANTLPTSWAAVQSAYTDLLYDRWQIYALLLALGLAALVWQPVRSRQGARQVVVLLLAVGGISFALVMLSNLQLRSYNPRRVIYLLPLYAILIGYLMAHLPRWVGGLLVVGGLALAWNVPPPAEWGVGNWFFRQSVEAVAEQAQTGDSVLIYFSGELEMLPLHYYADRLLPKAVPFTMQTDDVVRVINTAWARDRLWVIWADNAPPIFGEPLDQKGYVEIRKQRVGWLNVSLFQADQPPREAMSNAAEIPDKTPLPQTFGGMFNLVDYQINKLSAKPNESVTVWLDWQAIKPADQDYGVYVHLIEDDFVTLHGQLDGAPSHRGRDLTTTFWGSGATIYDAYTFTVNPDTPPGVYNIKIGMYSYLVPLRLSVAPGDGINTDGLVIAKFTVVAP